MYFVSYVSLVFLALFSVCCSVADDSLVTQSTLITPFSTEFRRTDVAAGSSQFDSVQLTPASVRDGVELDLRSTSAAVIEEGSGSDGDDDNDLPTTIAAGSLRDYMTEDSLLPTVEQPLTPPSHSASPSTSKMITTTDSEVAIAVTEAPTSVSNVTDVVISHPTVEKEVTVASLSAQTTLATASPSAVATELLTATGTSSTVTVSEESSPMLVINTSEEPVAAGTSTLAPTTTTGLSAVIADVTSEAPVTPTTNTPVAISSSVNDSTEVTTDVVSSLTVPFTTDEPSTSRVSQQVLTSSDPVSSWLEGPVTTDVPAPEASSTLLAVNVTPSQLEFSATTQGAQHGDIYSTVDVQTLPATTTTTSVLEESTVPPTSVAKESSATTTSVPEVSTVPSTHVAELSTAPPTSVHEESAAPEESTALSRTPTGSQPQFNLTVTTEQNVDAKVTTSTAMENNVTSSFKLTDDTVNSTVAAVTSTNVDLENNSTVSSNASHPPNVNEEVMKTSSFVETTSGSTTWTAATDLPIMTNVKSYDNLTEQEFFNSVTVVFRKPFGNKETMLLFNQDVFKKVVICLLNLYEFEGWPNETLNETVCNYEISEKQSWDLNDDFTPLKPNDLVIVYPSPKNEDDKEIVVFFVKNTTSKVSGTIVIRNHTFTAIDRHQELLSAQMNMEVAELSARILVPRLITQKKVHGEALQAATMPHSLLLIILLAVASICILIIMMGLVCIKCRAQSGHWEKEGHDKSDAMRSEMGAHHLNSDEDIRKDENAQLAWRNGNGNGYLQAGGNSRNGNRRQNGSGMSASLDTTATTVVPIADDSDAWVDVPFTQMSPANERAALPETLDTKL